MDCQMVKYLTKPKNCLILPKKNLKKHAPSKKLYPSFSLFNYIHARVDDEVYKLRLIQIDFDENSPTELNVVFSDSIESVDSEINDTKSILQQASAIATSYSSTAKQAKQGSNAMNTFYVLKDEGLSSAEYIIKNNADEEIVIDNTGITCKSMNDEGCYGDHQLKIMGNMIALTDDAWASKPRMALGYTKINNRLVYGVVADAIVGNFIVGEELVITNGEDGGVTINDEGITIDGSKGEVFKILNKNEKKTLWLDGDGNAHFTNIEVTGSDVEGKITATSGIIGKQTGKHWVMGSDDQSAYLYSGCNSLKSSDAGIYIGTDGIKNCNNNYQTTIENGTLYSNNIVINGGIINTIGSENGRFYLNASKEYESDVGDAYMHIDGSIHASNGIWANNVTLQGGDLTLIGGNIMLNGAAVATEPWVSSNFASAGHSHTTEDINAIFENGYLQFSGGHVPSIDIVNDAIGNALTAKSDYRIKKNISLLSNVKDFYLDLKPKQYQFKESDSFYDSKLYYTGVIAQELQSNLEKHNLNANCNSLVRKLELPENSPNCIYSDNNEILGVNYNNLHAYHIAFGQEIYKELTYEIASLKQENTETKQELSSLRQEIEELKKLIKQS